MTPKTMQAIKIVSAGKAEVQTAPVPKLRDHYIFVKNTAVAINPTDWYELETIVIDLRGIRLTAITGSTSTTTLPQALQ